MFLPEWLLNLLKLPFVRLSDTAIAENILRILPEDYARSHEVVVYGIDEKNANIATTAKIPIDTIKPFLKRRFAGLTDTELAPDGKRVAVFARRSYGFIK